MNHFGFVQAAADLLPRFHPKEFFRPGQVDPNGNFNNIALGGDYARPRLRLPGTGGIPDVTVSMPNIYLYVPRHSRVTFVPTLDYLSGLGHHPARRRGAGPRALISDLGLFDFPHGRMRLTHLHAGVRLEQVQAKPDFHSTRRPPGETGHPRRREAVREQIIRWESGGWSARRARRRGLRHPAAGTRLTA
jgi:hypothetical protein